MTKKRTFLVFFIIIFINALILLGILVLYQKLGKIQRIFKSSEDEISTQRGESGSESDTDTNEQTKLSTDVGN